MDRSNTDEVVSRVRNYWQSHTLGKQFVRDGSLEPGTREFFDHVRPWMTPFRFTEIMERIERESAKLKGKRLLEIGCGMGFDSVEFLKRGVRVTSTDLTQAAVDLTAGDHFPPVPPSIMDVHGFPTWAREHRVQGRRRAGY